jgi:hypothetical protein
MTVPGGEARRDIYTLGGRVAASLNRSPARTARPTRAPRLTKMSWNTVDGPPPEGAGPGPTGGETVGFAVGVGRSVGVGCAVDVAPVRVFVG